MNAGQGESPLSKPGIWPLVGALGLALALPGLIIDLPTAARAALVVAGAPLAAAGLIGWLQEKRSGPLPAARPQGPAGPAQVYEPPTAARRSEARALTHQQALRDIARLRFNYPTNRYRDYRTYLNHPQRTMGVQMPDGSVAYPDIVVVQAPENYTKIVAQVETAETVDEEVARHEWLPYSQLAPLYLYVPVGKGDEALAICRRLDVPVAGIRTWRYVVGYDEIEINEHYTA